MRPHRTALLPLIAALLLALSPVDAQALSLPSSFNADIAKSEELRERIRTALRDQVKRLDIPDYAGYGLEKAEDMAEVYLDVISEQEFYYCFQPRYYEKDYVVPMYYTDKERCRSEENAAELGRLINEFNADLDEDWGELHKAKFIHDKLVSSLYYRNGDGITMPIQDSPLLALKKGYATCVGYARTYALLLENAGIESVVTYEWSGSGHATNLVKLCGHWYHADCTADDDPGWSSDRVRWQCFLKSDDGWKAQWRRKYGHAGAADTTLFDQCPFDAKGKLCFDKEKMYLLISRSDRWTVTEYDAQSGTSCEFYRLMRSDAPDTSVKDISADDGGIYLTVKAGGETQKKYIKGGKHNG